MKARRITWPIYLAITVGVVFIVEFIFEVIGLTTFSLLGVVLMAGFFVICDFFTSDLPGQDRDMESGDG